MGKAGDLTIHGARRGVKVLRTEGESVKVYEVDLTNAELFNSEAYYLKQNDVIYVMPNKPRVNASLASPVAQYLISATGLLVTIISIITR